MTKEELVKEAEEWLCNNLHSASEEDFIKAMVDIAEPREKRIVELEYQLTHRNCLDCSNHSSKLRMRNLALEKENAELKEELKDANEKVLHLACNQNKDLKRKFTKAKEIIKHLLNWQYDEYKKSETDKELFKVIAEAEQFLNSEVEK